MSKRSAERPSNPVGWEGVGFGLNAATLGGRSYAAVLEAFPDATPFELECALTLSPYLGSFLRAEDAVARVGALREARRGRPDLSEADWQQCVRLLYRVLSEQQRQNPTELLTAVAALRPSHNNNAVADPPRGLSAETVAGLASRGPGRPGWRRRPFEEHLERAYRLAEEPKTIPDVAERFVALNGDARIEPEHLRSLLRRWRRGELPE